MNCWWQWVAYFFLLFSFVCLFLSLPLFFFFFFFFFFFWFGLVWFVRWSGRLCALVGLTTESRLPPQLGPGSRGSERS